MNEGERLTTGPDDNPYVAPASDFRDPPIAREEEEPKWALAVAHQRAAFRIAGGLGFVLAIAYWCLVAAGALYQITRGWTILLSGGALMSFFGILSWGLYRLRPWVRPAVGAPVVMGFGLALFWLGGNVYLAARRGVPLDVLKIGSGVVLAVSQLWLFVLLQSRPAIRVLSGQSATRKTTRPSLRTTIGSIITGCGIVLALMLAFFLLEVVINLLLRKIIK